MPRKERPLSGPDSALLRLAEDLRGLRARAGNPTYRELSRRAHYSPAALSAAVGGHRLPSLAVTLAYVRACGADEPPWRERWHTVATEVAAATAPTETPERAPYLGAAAFQAGDAAGFFGRDTVLAELRARLAGHRLVAVLGATGAGKSSLLHAGLSATGAPAVVFAPGRYPLTACANRLAELTGDTAATVRARLTRRPSALHDLAGELLARTGAEQDLLFVIDRFEDLVTRCQDPGERAVLIAALAFAATTAGSRVRVLLALRADHLAECLRQPGLSAVLGGPRIVLGPPSADELRQIVLAPATAAGLSVETALVSRVVAEAVGRPGALPLLSQAMLETWRRRRGSTLTLAGYERAGGIPHMIARAAEQTYAALDAAGQEIARQVFLRLTALGEEAEDTPRRLGRGELAATPAVTEVLDRLAAARLVTLDQGGVELAHEAPLRHWPRLRDWLARDRDGLHAHRGLTAATQAWQALDRDPDALFRGLRLRRTLDWAATDPALLSAGEQDFLAASDTAEAATRATEIRRRRRLRGLVTALCLLLTVSTAAAVLVARGQAEAADQRDTALARKVLTEAAALRETDPALAGQLTLAAHRLAPGQDTRDGLFSSVVVPPARRLTGHTEAVRRIAYSPDGRTLASGGWDHTVRLWGNGREPVVLRGHTAAVAEVAFSPDGRTLASAGGEGVLRLWDLTRPEQPARLAELTGHPGAVHALAFSPDGRVLASAGLDTAVRLWDLRDPGHPVPLTTLAVPDPLVNALRFSPDGRTLAAGGRDGAVRLWAIGDPHRAAALSTTIGAGEIQAMGFSPDGRLLAVARTSGEVRLWALGDPRRPHELATLTGHTGPVWAVAFSPDGALLATGGDDQTTRLWAVAEPDRPRALSALPGHTNAVHSVAFHPDGTALATAGDKTVRVEDLRGHALAAHPSSVRAAAFSPDGLLLAAGDEDGAVHLWDPAGPRRIGTLTAHTGAITVTAFSPAGHILLTAGAVAATRLWDLSAPDRPRPLGGLAAGIVHAASFTPDGRTLATAGADNTIRLWDLGDPAHPAPLASLAGQRGGIRGLAFSPDGGWLVSVAGEGSLRVWEIADRTRPRVRTALSTGAPGLAGLALSPDGRVLAIAGAEHPVRLWDLRDPGHPVPLATLTGHPDTVTAVVFGPDGRTLATVGADGGARLWDLADPARPAELGTLRGHRKAVWAAAFSPDGRILATAGHDRAIRLWATDLDRAADRICGWDAPGITPADWARHLPGLPYRPPCR
ncbi:nSTAND1 domain-containing NTPase [Crossiella sp. CA198]|uniref:nSTAND1 domain-containing NTPase n=1 Tax=Crossiella sp. CA198 TaxID=3455607 RepID=UPI003F8D52F6